MASQIGTLGGSIERLSHELHLMKPLLPTYVHLVISAIFPIYTAAHASLVRPSSALPAKKPDDNDDNDHEDDDDDDAETEEVSSKIETLTPSDALLFPIMAGCTLAGLYFILKFLQDPAWLNWFLGLYFACIGFLFMMRFLQDGFSIARSFLLPRQYSAAGNVWMADNTQKRFAVRHGNGEQLFHVSPLPGLLRWLPLPSKISNLIWNLRPLVYAKARLEVSIRNLISFKVAVEALDMICLCLTTLVIGYHTFVDKPWYLTNLLGFSFCYGSLQFMTPGTSWTGTLLLGALFFYDIYFVFFTPMMVTVATKLDVPIKLLFPRPDGCVYPVGAEEGSDAMDAYFRCVAKKRTMAMLGLGDIVIPGMMLAFALRFDLYLFYLRKKTTAQDQNAKQTKEKPAYSPATGSWGERFWVTRKFHAQLFGGKRFPKTYFHATVVGYIFGMLTTVLVMQIANHAQPALLYLVPGVLISLWGTALVKGDIKLLWEYSEMPTDENDQKKTLDEGSADKDANAIDGSKDVAQEDKEVASTDSNTTSGTAPASLGPKDHLFYLAIMLPEAKNAKKIKSSTLLASKQPTEKPTPVSDSRLGGM